jgi:hypothetical protein
MLSNYEQAITTFLVIVLILAVIIFVPNYMGREPAKFNTSPDVNQDFQTTQYALDITNKENYKDNILDLDTPVQQTFPMCQDYGNVYPDNAEDYYEQNKEYVAESKPCGDMTIDLYPFPAPVDLHYVPVPVPKSIRGSPSGLSNLTMLSANGIPN